MARRCAFEAREHAPSVPQASQKHVLRNHQRDSDDLFHELKGAGTSACCLTASTTTSTNSDSGTTRASAPSENWSTCRCTTKVTSTPCPGTAPVTVSKGFLTFCALGIDKVVRQERPTLCRWTESSKPLRFSVRRELPDVASAWSRRRALPCRWIAPVRNHWSVPQRDHGDVHPTETFDVDSDDVATLKLNRSSLCRKLPRGFRHGFKIERVAAQLLLFITDDHVFGKGGQRVPPLNEEFHQERSEVATSKTQTKASLMCPVTFICRKCVRPETITRIWISNVHVGGKLGSGRVEQQAPEPSKRVANHQRSLAGVRSEVATPWKGATHIWASHLCSKHRHPVCTAHCLPQKTSLSHSASPSASILKRVRIVPTSVTEIPRPSPRYFSWLSSFLRLLITLIGPTRIVFLSRIALPFDTVVTMFNTHFSRHRISWQVCHNPALAITSK